MTSFSCNFFVFKMYLQWERTNHFYLYFVTFSNAHLLMHFNAPNGLCAKRYAQNDMRLK